MTNLIKFAIFIIGACSLLSPTNASCPVQNHPVQNCQVQNRPEEKCPVHNCPEENCFDCNKCEKDCNNLAQNCDTYFMTLLRKFLCNEENENCMKTRGCDVPPVPVTIYPAANFDESYAEWKAKTFQTRKNCCYNLSGYYLLTLSGIITNGACIQLFDGDNCTGQSVKYDGTRGTGTVACEQWIDCDARVAADGFYFNDKTRSFKRC